MSICKTTLVMFFILGASAFAADKPAVEARERMESDARGENAVLVAFQPEDTEVLDATGPYESSNLAEPPCAMPRDTAGENQAGNPINVSYQPSEVEIASPIELPVERFDSSYQRVDRGTKPSVQARQRMESGS
jgi:hypothetical protein